MHGFNAWAQGVGEQLQPIELDQHYYVVIVPPVHVSTAEIFSHPQLTRDAKPITIRDFLAGRGVNHLQAVTCTIYPQVQEVLDWLSGHELSCEQARMSGSGSAVFVRTQTLQSAKDMVEFCPISWQAFFARGLTKHPHR